MRLRGRIFLATFWLASAVYASASTTGRTITISSQCQGQTIRVGVNGGFVQACGQNGSCPTGTACDSTRNPPGCFWTFPSPQSGSAVLNAGDSVVYTLTAPAINGQQWSGNLYAASGCNSSGTNCAIGFCVDGSGTMAPCTAGTGPDGPVSLAEFTLLANGPDTYDVSIANGMNAAVSMAPVSVTSQAGSNAYFCQTAGATSPSSTGLLACSWSFTPPAAQSSVLAAVMPGGPPCPATGSCPSGQTCGYAGNPATGAVTQACGTQIGWWSANELCGFTNSAFGAPINCAAVVPNQGTVANLLECDGQNATTCYGSSTSSCCGCPSWVVGGKTLLATMPCLGTNPQWTSLAMPWSQFLKNACPTAYTFAFDDATSTFTCNSANTGPSAANTMSYNITFCPGGNSGVPTNGVRRRREARHRQETVPPGSK